MSTMAVAVTKIKTPTVVDLTELTKEELIEKIRKQEAHIVNLKNIIAKQVKPTNTSPHPKNKQRAFDFKQYNVRHVALQVAYLGWDWHGFTVQDNTGHTVEGAVFEALLKTRLIEARETSNYHRCGRTDKGVSALGQVISIDLRTNLKEGLGVRQVADPQLLLERKNFEAEIRFAHILNKVLPRDIRVIGWAPVQPDFSARFDCVKRTYTYFFPKGDLDLDLIQNAAQKLIGSHDFRNLCKMDVGNGVTQFIRRIYSIQVQTLSSGSEFNPPPLKKGSLQLCELKVIGSGFLWHQIRCIVAILFLVGEKLEPPEIVAQLLDIETHPRKPQFNMASDFPLNLYSVVYPAITDWCYDHEGLVELVLHYQDLFVELSIKSAMCGQALETVAPILEASLADPSVLSSEDKVLKTKTEDIQKPYNSLIIGSRMREYKPLFERPLCESLEDQVDHFVKRHRIARADNTGNHSNTGD